MQGMEASAPAPKVSAESPVDITVQAAGKTAGMVADYGMLVMVGTLFLAMGASALWLTVRYFNRRTSSDYVHKEALLEEARRRYPNLFRSTAAQLPDLRHHRLFSSTTKLMRAAEAITDSDPATLMARDLCVWTLRAHRDAFADILEAAYDHINEFESRMGDADAVRAKVENAYNEISAAVRYRLVDEFRFPPWIYDGWQASREQADAMMVDVLELALENPEPYWQIRSILDSVFARCSMLRLNVAQFFKTMPRSMSSDMRYEPAEGVNMSTMPALSTGTNIRSHQGGYPAALFEKKRDRNTPRPGA
jgi:hypothetical protein